MPRQKLKNKNDTGNVVVFPGCKAPKQTESIDTHVIASFLNLPLSDRIEVGQIIIGKSVMNRLLNRKGNKEC